MEKCAPREYTVLSVSPAEKAKSAAVARSMSLHPTAHRQSANATSIKAIFFFIAELLSGIRGNPLHN
jgi:hypothetical protein